MARWEETIHVLEDSVTRLGDKAMMGWHIIPLADAYTSVGRYDEALAQYERDASNDAGNDGERPGGAYPLPDIGKIHIERGDLTKAVGFLKEAVQQLEARWPWRSEDIGAIYLELGLVYRRTGQESQARKCFEKAVPLIEGLVDNQLKYRQDGKASGSLYRSEGRTLARLAWAYELLDVGDKKALEKYKQALWVFETAVWSNDDFFEKSECRDVKAAIERVERGEEWVYPGPEEDRERRRRARVLNYRKCWGVDLKSRENGIIEPR
jgi:tetratricopeptide (TPR) repeat protein